MNNRIQSRQKAEGSRRNRPPSSSSSSLSTAYRLLSTPRPRAFTLVELLVVIGIIGLLMGILIPVVNKVKSAGWRADSMNQINVLRSAIEAYHTTFSAYPGPLSNQQITAGVSIPDSDGPVTMSENLFLGICGGLSLTSGGFEFSTNPASNPLTKGDGPVSLNPRNPKTYQPFMPGALTQTSYRVEGGKIVGTFKEGETGATDTIEDSNIPEFLDRYPADPMPVLYLRAQKGADGVIDVAGTAQYDLLQIHTYTKNTNGKDHGIGGKLHGLQDLGDVTAPLKRSPLPNEALPYFRSSSPTAGGTPTPRGKDAFILISPGGDRTYGTTDDITSFGDVAQ